MDEVSDIRLLLKPYSTESERIGGANTDRANTSAHGLLCCKEGKTGTQTPNGTLGLKCHEEAKHFLRISKKDWEKPGTPPKRSSARHLLLVFREKRKSEKKKT